MNIDQLRIKLRELGVPERLLPSTPPSDAQWGIRVRNDEYIAFAVEHPGDTEVAAFASESDACDYLLDRYQPYFQKPGVANDEYDPIGFGDVWIPGGSPESFGGRRLDARDWWKP